MQFSQIFILTYIISFLSHMSLIVLYNPWNHDALGCVENLSFDFEKSAGWDYDVVLCVESCDIFKFEKFWFFAR